MVMINAATGFRRVDLAKIAEDLLLMSSGPRTGFAWDVTGKGRQKLYASFGIFYDIMKYELPRGSFGGNVWKEYFHALDDPNIRVLKITPDDAEFWDSPGSVISYVKMAAAAVTGTRPDLGDNSQVAM